jgi:hypothetical protein
MLNPGGADILVRNGWMSGVCTVIGGADIPVCHGWMSGRCTHLPESSHISSCCPNCPAPVGMGTPTPFA